VERVQQLVRKEMLQQKTELADVAQLLGMHRRTLSRRLRAEGTQFTFILSEMRFAVSRQLVAETDIPLAQVSAMLHFSEPAAFTRAFERWSGGMSPSQMRADHKRSPTA